MENRQSGGHRKSWRKRYKFPLIVMITTIIIGSSLNIVFAEKDISGLLTEWFQTKKSESIEDVERAIIEEQKVQTERLKAKLQEEIEEANTRLQEFTEDEKSKRIEAIRNYADELLESIDTRETELMADIDEAINEIINHAMDEIDEVYEQNIINKEEN